MNVILLCLNLFGLTFIRKNYKEFKHAETTQSGTQRFLTNQGTDNNFYGAQPSSDNVGNSEPTITADNETAVYTDVQSPPGEEKVYSEPDNEVRAEEKIYSDIVVADTNVTQYDKVNKF